jgi:hypothetical protein
MIRNPLPNSGFRPGKYPTTLVQGLRRVIRDKKANAKQVLRACELLMLLDPQVPAGVREKTDNPNVDRSLEELLRKTTRQAPTRMVPGERNERTYMPPDFT